MGRGQIGTGANEGLDFDCLRVLGAPHPATCHLLEATGPELTFSRTPCFLTVSPQILPWGCKIHNIV